MSGRTPLNATLTSGPLRRLAATLVVLALALVGLRVRAARLRSARR